MFLNQYNHYNQQYQHPETNALRDPRDHVRFSAPSGSIGQLHSPKWKLIFFRNMIVLDLELEDRGQDSLKEKCHVCTVLSSVLQLKIKNH